MTKAWCSGVHAIAHSYHHRNCTFASSEITHTHTYTYVAFHIAFILSYFDSTQTILHWIILLSTQLNPTQPNHRVWYEAVQNHYKWRRHASELSPAGSWLYRLCTHHLSFIIHSFGNLLSWVSKWVVLLCL